MKHEIQWVATQDIAGISAAGKRMRIRIMVSAPYLKDVESDEWACSVAVRPMLKARRVHGLGSLQALCLGLSLVRMSIDAFVRDGGGLYFPTGEAFPLEAVLGSIRAPEQ